MLSGKFFIFCHPIYTSHYAIYIRICCLDEEKHVMQGAVTYIETPLLRDLLSVRAGGTTTVRKTSLNVHLGS